MHLDYEVWSVTQWKWDSEALENHWTVHNTFLLFQNASCEPYMTQASQWVWVKLVRLIFLNSYLLTMWHRHTNLTTNSITIYWCSTMIACVPVLNIWRRNHCIFCFKAGMILTLQMFSTYCQQLVISVIHAKPIFHASSNVRWSLFAVQYHNRYRNGQILMSTDYPEVPNHHYLQTYQKRLGFPTLDSISVYKLERTIDK